MTASCKIFYETREPIFFTIKIILVRFRDCFLLVDIANFSILELPMKIFYLIMKVKSLEILFFLDVIYMQTGNVEGIVLDMHTNSQY